MQKTFRPAASDKFENSVQHPNIFETSALLHQSHCMPPQRVFKRFTITFSISCISKRDNWLCRCIAVLSTATVKTKYSQAECLGSTIKSSGFTVAIRKINRLASVFISWRWRKVANVYIQVHTVHKGDRQGPTNKWNKFLSDSLPTPLVESMSFWSNYESKKMSSETSVSRIFGGIVLVKITHLRNFCVMWSVWNQWEMFGDKNK